MTAGAVLLAGLAAVFAATRIGHFHRDGEAGAKVWFYDQKAQRLYAAPRDLIPPDGDDGNRVRAVVIGFQGMGGDASQVKIAYLEKYAPELKALLERARDAHAAKRPFTEKIPPANSAFTQDNTMVKHPGEAMWSALGTAEARQIMSEWRAWRGPSGQQPMISVPTLQ
ncbi:MAG TPA: hypothetical protein VGO59_20960 [Verrucomicrobiae bacterium]